MVVAPPAEVMVIELSNTTSILVEPDIEVPGSVAVMEIPLTAPVSAHVARPLELNVTFGSLDVHVTDEVISNCVPSEYVPVALNCCLPPLGAINETPAGTVVTAIDSSTAELAVKVAVPDIKPIVALIVEDPELETAVARPVAKFIVATFTAEDAHVTDVVMSSVVSSEYVPVAVNCRVRPSGTFALSGVTTMDTSVAGVTVKVVVPDIEPSSALIVNGPPSIVPVARPLVVEEKVTDESEAVHVTDEVTS